MLNDILSLDQLQWLPKRSDFTPIFITLIPGLTFTELGVVSIEHLQRVASQQGTLNLSCTWFRPLFWTLAYAPIVEISFIELAVSVLDIWPWIPLGTYSIFPISYLVYGWPTTMMIQGFFVVNMGSFNQNSCFPLTLYINLDGYDDAIESFNSY